VRLHQDTGIIRLFEFPKSDPPIQYNGHFVEDSFRATLPFGGF
jgi:hypothetical protein